MYDYLIRDMTGAVSQALGIDISNSEEREKIYKALKSFWSMSIADVWGVDDVQDCAQYHFESEGNFILTVDQAIEVLQNIQRNLDASTGITWEEVEAHTWDYIKSHNIQPTNEDEEEVY